MFKSKYGVDVDDEDSDEETELDDDQSIEYEDGVKFIVTHGAGPQYGKVEEKFADGIMWTVTRGRPLSIDALLERLDEVKEIYADRSSAVRGAAPSCDALECKLKEVKAMFKSKYGVDVDDEDSDEETELDDDQSIEYEDGVKFIVTHGAGPQYGKVEEKFADGIMWTVTRGRPLSIDALLERLDEVKEIYEEKNGPVEVGGNHVHDSRGAPPTCDALECKLKEIKALFNSKYDTDIDDKESEEETDLDDDQSIEYEGGVKYVVTHGAGPQYGKVEEKFADGIMWTVTRGRPLSVESLLERLEYVKSFCPENGVEKRGTPPSCDALESKLEHVKALFKAKYGNDVDEDEEVSDVEDDLDDDQSVQFEGGVKYIVTHGPGPQFGKVEEKMVDGIQWIVTRGRPLTIEALERQLEEVKDLYQFTHGSQPCSDSEAPDAHEPPSEPPHIEGSSEEDSWGCVCS
eukprot:TRINITY_DN1791_c0_g1_i1.p1 TRINITY_DN1791_c0_g1~~TRINITY_DN1791_c0_g1_i1.p1  ORF type:complete len:460 (+),score=115.28 TRINITY_DN1791_c0_g1_i1:3-1382(+)